MTAGRISNKLGSKRRKEEKNYEIKENDKEKKKNELEKKKLKKEKRNTRKYVKSAFLYIFKNEVSRVMCI